ncbi:hypothetical protein S40288_11698, partial [Stachybotrys chartarum IBT 40288]
MYPRNVSKQQLSSASQRTQTIQSGTAQRRSKPSSLPRPFNCPVAVIASANSNPYSCRARDSSYTFFPPPPRLQPLPDFPLGFNPGRCHGTDSGGPVLFLWELLELLPRIADPQDQQQELQDPAAARR